jgi:hypothetical protein
MDVKLQCFYILGDHPQEALIQRFNTLIDHGFLIRISAVVVVLVQPEM